MLCIKLEGSLHGCALLWSGWTLSSVVCVTHTSAMIEIGYEFGFYDFIYRSSFDHTSLSLIVYESPSYILEYRQIGLLAVVSHLGIYPDALAWIIPHS